MGRTVCVEWLREKRDVGRLTGGKMRLLFMDNASGNDVSDAAKE